MINQAAYSFQPSFKAVIVKNSDITGIPDLYRRMHFTPGKTLQNPETDCIVNILDGNGQYCSIGNNPCQSLADHIVFISENKNGKKRAAEFALQETLEDANIPAFYADDENIFSLPIAPDAVNQVLFPAKERVSAF